MGERYALFLCAFCIIRNLFGQSTQFTETHFSCWQALNLWLFSQRNVFVTPTCFFYVIIQIWGLGHFIGAAHTCVQLCNILQEKGFCICLSLKQPYSMHYEIIIPQSCCSSLILQPFKKTAAQIASGPNYGLTPQVSPLIPQATWSS